MGKWICPVLVLRCSVHLVVVPRLACGNLSLGAVSFITKLHPSCTHAPMHLCTHAPSRAFCFTENGCTGQPQPRLPGTGAQCRENSRCTLPDAILEFDAWV